MEIRPFITEFIHILMKDIIYKLNRKSNKLESIFYFNDLILADIVFF